MSHFTTLVIGDDIEAQLAPYDENIQVEPYPKPMGDYIVYAAVRAGLIKEGEELPKPLSQEFIDGVLSELRKDTKTEFGFNDDGFYEMSRYNPKSKWDWWTVGGRWSGFWVLKEGAIGVYGDRQPGNFLEQAVMKAVSGKEVTIPDKKNGRADQARLKDIDLETMIVGEAARAMKVFRTFEPAFQGQKLPRWSDIRDKYPKDQIDQARKEYREHPVVQSIEAMAKLKNLYLPIFGDYNEYFCDGDMRAMIAREATASVTTYAVVEKGEWYEPGQMGWWGMSSETPEQKEKWQKDFLDRFLLSQRADTMLTIVDCHI